MEQLVIKNLTVRIAENINYVWVLINEQTNREEFVESLGDSDFHKLLKQNTVKNLLVDCSNMWSFGIPEMSEYLDVEFMTSMRSIGVEKISVIINDEVFSMLSFVFQGIENSHSRNSPKLRFFSGSQFYQSFESVNWF